MEEAFVVAPTDGYIIEFEEEVASIQNTEHEETLGEILCPNLYISAPQLNMHVPCLVAIIKALWVI